MTDSKQPKPPTTRGPGAMGSSHDFDSDADALLDSLMFDEVKPSVPPPSIKLHEPVEREYSEEDVTVVGKTQDLLARFSNDDGTSGLEELESSEIDQLLSSLPPGPVQSDSNSNTPLVLPRLPEMPRSPAVPALPRVPLIPRPLPRVPAASQNSIDATAKPPAINPAGLPARQPFPPAVSPRPPNARDTKPSSPPPRPSFASDPADRPSPIPKSERQPLSHLPTLSVGATDAALAMPAIPRAQGLPRGSFDPIPRPPAPASAERDAPVQPSGPNQSSEPRQSSEPSPPSERFGSTSGSSAPPGLQPSQPPPIWPDERPAQDHLSGQSEAWTTRAEWLESEAQASLDVQAKARLLVLASELWALLGDLPRARQVASDASALPRAQSVALRQLRALAAADGDYKAVAPALEIEIRGATTVEARVHAAYLSAEVHRLALHDDAAAKKKLDLAIRAHQDDPRAHIAKLAELLGKSNAPARLRWPDSEALRELSRANEHLARLRGAPGSGSDSRPESAFDDARRALSEGELGAAAQALDRLAAIDGLGDAAAWLSASLRGADPKTRGEASSALSALEAHHGSRLARRALVRRALEVGDRERVHAVLQSAGAGPTFSAAERLALAALSGHDDPSLRAVVEDVARDPELRPLAAAFAAANPSVALETLAGNDSSRAEQRLGRALARVPSEAPGASLRADAALFEASHPRSALARLLALEFAKEERAKGDVALGLAEWSSAGDEREPQHCLAAALIHELATEHKSARMMYRRAFELDGNSEAALRALSNFAPAETGDLLLKLADALADSPRAAMAVLEAALREPPESGRYGSLVERATSADPELPFGYRLAEMAARRRADRDAVLRAVQSRREASDDPLERALDALREASLVSDRDPASAERLLDEAQRVRPSDLWLREWLERVSSAPSAEKADFREGLAETSAEPMRAQLLAEAALERARGVDLEAAARDAHRAAEGSANELFRVMAEHYALRGPAAQISETLLERARNTNDAREQRELYERLSQIDRARGESSSAMLWQSTILEQSPDHLPALRRLEHAYITSARVEELESIAARLANLVDPGEADAHARLAASLRVLRGAWPETRELAEITLAHSPGRAWALRSLSAHARVHGDDELALRVEQRLLDATERPLDKATLALRAAEAAARLGRPEDSKRLLAAALEPVPDHLLALSTLSDVLEANEEYVSAAIASERLAMASQVTSHQVSAWHHAAVLWLDKASNPDRGRAALERAVALDAGHEDAVVRLQSLYVAQNERQKLAELLERRLERTTDPEERIAIEVTRGRALAEVGEREAAKAALSAALDANPDHAEALEAFAELCFAEGDWTHGEQALIRLARHVLELPRQAQVYRRLGELYDTALPNPERAELAYKEVLKRDPDDADTVARLVQVYARVGDKEAALALQTELLNRAKNPQEKRDRTLALAMVEDQVALDRRRAELTFDKARKEWPHDSAVLRALVEFYRRNNDERATQLLLHRAASDARRALSTGRFEPGFFEVLATVAELKNSGDAALVARATLAALYGEEVAVPAAGPIAGDPRLDDLLAPELVSAPLRALLRKSGAVLDLAYTVDLRALRAASLPASAAAFTSYVQQVASSFGIHGLEVLASPLLGPVCTPIGSAAPQIVFGQSLLDSEDDAARYFLLIRCLKILQGNAAALSRTPAIELWPVLAAHLSLFAPSWVPQGVDGKKLAEAQRRIQAAMPARLDDDVPVLALEVIGAIGNRASLLGTALHQWGNRTALLSAGSLVASLRGVALASGLVAGPPKEGPDRVKWIVRNPEARDLATFGVSEQYAETRARLGLAR